MKFLVLFGCVVALTAMMPLCIEGQKWDSWGQWTSCSKTCGGGMRERKTQCDHPQKKCSTQTEACNYQACNASGSSSGLNATSGPTDAKNDTTGPSPSEGLKSTSNGPTTGDILEETVSTKPPQEDETDEFVGSGTIKAREWSDELGNPISQENKELKNNCDAKLKETFKGEEGVIAANVIKFTQGSVVMHFRVKTLHSREVSSSRLQSVLAWSAKSGAMKYLGISSFQLSRVTQPSEESNTHMGDGSNNDDDDVLVDSWKFFLYGFGAMIALAIIFVLLAITKIKLVPKSQDELEDESPGFERKFSFPGKDKIPELEDKKKVEKESDDNDCKTFDY